MQTVDTRFNRAWHIAFVLSGCLPVVAPLSHFYVLSADSDVGLLNDLAQVEGWSEGAKAKLRQELDDADVADAEEEGTALQSEIALQQEHAALDDPWHHGTVGQWKLNFHARVSQLNVSAPATGNATETEPTSMLICNKVDPCFLGITKMIWAFLLTGLSMVAIFFAMILTLGYSKKKTLRQPQLSRHVTQPAGPAGQDLLLQDAAYQEQTLERRMTTGELGVA